MQAAVPGNRIKMNRRRKGGHQKPRRMSQSNLDTAGCGDEPSTGIFSKNGVFSVTGCRREERITEGAKRRQMAQMLTLILTPIIVLLCVSFYFVSDNIVAKMDADKVRNTILFSVEVGKLVHVMQKERDMSVLYLSSIGPETRTFLTERYLETDEQLANLPYWPADLDIYERSYFATRRSFQNYLTKHRNELDLLNHTLYDEILFYSDSIKVFVRWLYDAIIESKYGTIWKTLVAYQKVVVAKEDVGVERALGSAYFSLGGFVSQTIYEWYNEKLHVYNANIQSAVRYSALVKPIAESRISSGGKNLTDSIEVFRTAIQKRRLSKPSLRVATWYFDNMTLYVDLLFLVQNDLARAIVKTLDDRTEVVTTGVVVSSIIILIVVIMCPLLVKTVRSLTNDIQNYAITLVNKTKELDKEKKKTDSLFYQMLPQSVGEQLKRHKDVTAQYHKEVTIFFSDIVGFTYLTMELSPMEIVALLNRVYTLFDDRIELYDVYKVETIGDSYMVASGLPKCNGTRHASEIANMSLDLMATTAQLEIDIIPQKKINLRIGIHTGPCVAGVLGSQLPRYCLFGDTVNTASRMETTGLANRIHISVTTYRLLAKTSGYVLQMRGPIEVKGKGRMVTYWLMGRATPGMEQDVSLAVSPDDTDRSPGSPTRKRRGANDVSAPVKFAPTTTWTSTLTAPVAASATPTAAVVETGSTSTTADPNVQHSAQPALSKNAEVTATSAVEQVSKQVGATDTIGNSNINATATANAGARSENKEDAESTPETAQVTHAHDHQHHHPPGGTGNQSKPGRKTPDGNSTNPEKCPEVAYDRRNAAKKTVPDPQPLNANPTSYEQMEKDLKGKAIPSNLELVEGHHY